jgi:hypothetical protein
MSSLTSAPVAEVLEELFADAARTQNAFLERMAQRPPATDGLSGSRPGDSREFFAMAKGRPSGRLTADRDSALHPRPVSPSS